MPAFLTEKTSVYPYVCWLSTWEEADILQLPETQIQGEMLDRATIFHYVIAESRTFKGKSDRLKKVNLPLYPAIIQAGIQDALEQKGREIYRGLWNHFGV